MKMCVFYTPSHEILYKEWFLPSLKDDFKLVACKSEEQNCVTGTYMEKGWIETMRTKIDFLLHMIQQHPGEIFACSDVDVQFFRPIKEILYKSIVDKDISFQRNSLSDSLCAGFFVCRANKKTLQLWLEIRKNLGTDISKHDQDWLNELLISSVNFRSKLFLNIAKRLRVSKYLFSTNIFSSNPFGIRWSYLPDSFWCPGLSVEKVWKPGDPLQVQPNIIFHHANWTEGVENKIAQLEYVRNIVNSRLKD